MITCQQAKHLFDRYLNGELPPSLQAELHAHQLKCGDCQGELALLEACGDVIAYDRREPVVSDSFTDRVLAMRRASIKPAPRRSWGRLVFTVGSPLAAAACITFAFLLMAPADKEVRPGKVLAGGNKVAEPLGRLLTQNSDRLDQDLPTVRQMPSGFIDTLAEPIVEQTKNVFDSTKRSIDQLDSLIRLGFAGANRALAAGSRTMDVDRSLPTDAVRPSVNEPDLMDPFSPRPSWSTPDPQNTFEVDDTIEAM